MHSCAGDLPALPCLRMTQLEWDSPVALVGTAPQWQNDTLERAHAEGSHPRGQAPHGKVASVVGVVLAVDVDSPREREWLRGLKIGCTSLRMPPVDSRSLARLLNHFWAAAEFAPLVPSARRTLVRSERSTRVGGPVRHTRRQLQAHVLATDTEMTLRGMAMP
jgi:hypothetical protein